MTGEGTKRVLHLFLLTSHKLNHFPDTFSELILWYALNSALIFAIWEKIALPSLKKRFIRRYLTYLADASVNVFDTLRHLWPSKILYESNLLKRSGYYRYLHSKILRSANSVFIRFVWISGREFWPIQHSVIGFITEAASVYCVVRTGSWNRIDYISLSNSWTRSSCKIITYCW